MSAYLITRRAVTDDEMVQEFGRHDRGEPPRYMPRHHSARMMSDPGGDGFLLMRRLNEFWHNYHKAEQWLIRFESDAEATMFRMDWSDYIEAVEEVR